MELLRRNKKWVVLEGVPADIIEQVPSMGVRLDWPESSALGSQEIEHKAVRTLP